MTFLSHFIICLACAGVGFFAWTRGVPQMVYASDLSMTTSAIAALFVLAAGQIGWQAWRIDDKRLWGVSSRTGAYGLLSSVDINSDFGHLAEKLSVRIGLAGTVIGLAMQGKSLMGGASSFGALSTSLFTTAVGVGAASILAVMLYNLDHGIKRSGR
jgi:hypothetical protein